MTYLVIPSLFVKIKQAAPAHLGALTQSPRSHLFHPTMTRTFRLATALPVYHPHDLTENILLVHPHARAASLPHVQAPQALAVSRLHCINDAPVVATVHHFPASRYSMPAPVQSDSSLKPGHLHSNHAQTLPASPRLPRVQVRPTVCRD